MTMTDKNSNAKCLFTLDTFAYYGHYNTFTLAMKKKKVKHQFDAAEGFLSQITYNFLMISRICFRCLEFWRLGEWEIF